MDEKDFLDCVNFIYEQMCSEQMCSWINENNIKALEQEIYGLGKLLMEYKADK